MVNGDSTTADSVVSYRNVTVPVNCTWNLGLRSTIKISGVLTVNGTILGSQTGAGAGVGGNGPGSLSYKNSAGVSMTAGDGGGGGGHRFSGGTTQNVNSGGGNITAGGSAYNNVTALTASSSFSAQLQNGSSGGYGHGAGSGAAGGPPGAGGGSFRIMAKDVVVNAGGVITARGASGGSGTGGTYEDGGGGGGGGSGGTVWIIAGRISGTGAINADGGGGGSGGQGNQGANGTGGGGGSCGYVRLDIGIWGATQPTTTSLRYTANNFSQGYTNEAAIVTTGSYVVALDDTTAPSIGTPVNSFTSAGSNQNQIVTVSITDTQTAVSNPTAVFQTVTGTNSGTVTLTSFTSGTATFTVSNQTGSGTARIFITAVDAAGNSATAYSPAWTIDNSPPSGYVPYFGYGTDNWILDGRTISGLTYFSGTQIYAVTAANDPTLDYSYSLASLTIPAGFSLIWCGVLYLYVNGTSTINGTLGWTSTAMGDGTTMRNGGGTGGLGGRSSSYSSYYPNRDVGFWGGTEGQDNPSGYGWTSSGLWSYGPIAGDRTTVSWPDTPTAYGGNPGWRLWKNPNSADTISSVLARGVAVGGGGSGGACCYNDQRGGNGAWGGPGLVFKTQTLNGSGVITVSARGGEQKGGSATRQGEASGGAGGGGHSVIIAGTSNFTGSLSADYGYNTFWRNAGSTPSATPAITNTTIVDTTIPATSSDNQPSVTSAILTSSYRKNGQVQRISISYSKTMTDSEVKITLSGAATLAATVMTKAASPANTYYYDYTHGTGNGTITYSIAAKDNVLNPAATVSGSWILDNTAPSFTSSISPNKTFFFGGESISYTITGTEANSMISVPSISLVKGSDFYGTSPPTVSLTTSSVSGSTTTYSSSTTLPIGIGTISATVSGTDIAANTGTNSGLSTIKLLPPSGMLWS